MFTRDLTDRILDTIDGHTIVETPSCSACGTYGAIALTPGELAAVEAGDLIQDAAPRLSRAEREQLISGIHPGCWDRLYGSLDD